MQQLHSFLLLLFVTFAIVQVSCELREFIKWKHVEYENLPGECLSEIVESCFQFLNATCYCCVVAEAVSKYVQYDNVPQGFSPYLKDSKVFVSVPRRRPGIPCTLTYVKTGNRSLYQDPKLFCYPSYDMNELDVSFECYRKRESFGLQANNFFFFRFN